MAAIVILLALLAAVAFVIATFEKIIWTQLVITLSLLDTWWWPYKMLPRQGEFVIVADGTPNGPYYRLLESIDWHKYDESGDVFREDKTKSPQQEGRIPAVYVGFNKYLMWHKVSYNNWEQPDNSAEAKLVKKVRGVKGLPDAKPSHFFQWTLAIPIMGAEIEGLYKIDAVIQLTLHMVHPRKALFFDGSWESQVDSAVQEMFRPYVKPKTLDEIGAEKDAGQGGELSKKLVKLSEGTREEGGLEELCGIKVINGRLVKFDQVGAAEERAAATALKVATDKALAREQDGLGEQKFLENKAKGVAKLVEAYASHPDGWRLAMAEAVRDNKSLTAVGGQILAAVNATRGSTPPPTGRTRP